ncbi:hypothetical protein IHE56_15170 [Streptomyces sp. ID01-12c]|uniref:hypothetical protein n=1 Tax=Streptomyces caniscabiei TaxID=2746961 RepID=UPI0017858077|nr:hypothetical protein [Streptomyces caniscabiei]MBD9703398.1 hypothetical protein [Streptomyces caniscabiei]MDX3726888.1 hypothetical protein [Streptomyces caniscabiei]
MKPLHPTTEYIVPIGPDEWAHPRFRTRELAEQHAASHGLGPDKVITYDPLYQPGHDRAPDVHRVNIVLPQARASLERCQSKNIHSHGQMMAAASELDFVLRQLVAALDAERAPRPAEPAGADARASSAELLALAAADFAAAEAQRHVGDTPPPLSKELTGLAAEAAEATPDLDDA